MAIDFAIRNARLPRSRETTDIAVEGGLIAAIQPGALSVTRRTTTPAAGSSAEG